MRVLQLKLMSDLVTPLFRTLQCCIISLRVKGSSLLLFPAILCLLMPTILEHAQHASSSGSLPLLSPP